MALARAVTFDGVDQSQFAQMTQQMEGGERPEGLPATEICVLYDAEGGRSLVILFFENEDDYRKGDEVLNAMPAAETPGRRSSVTKYEVAFRSTA
ncbi:MAG TPA: hypothetical protein VFA56_12155 [Gaiellaceae bacterium]|nr:hypothetical protein [Gaiellaceae bacterium]